MLDIIIDTFKYETSIFAEVGLKEMPFEKQRQKVDKGLAVWSGRQGAELR